MKHNHTHGCQCKHETVKFCSHCQTIYCETCNQEWTSKPAYTWTHPYTNTWKLDSLQAIAGSTAQLSGYADPFQTSTTVCSHK